MPATATTLTRPSREAFFPNDLDIRHVDLRHRLKRQVDVAAEQTRAIGERTRESRTRDRLSAIVGVATGVAGLTGSVVMAVETGAVSSLWWLTVPTWVAAATSIAALLKVKSDGLPALHGRAVGATALARELLGIFDGTRSWAERDVLAARSLDRLSILVEDELKVTSVALRERSAAGQARRRHRRVVPRASKVIVTTADGRRLRATIADVSMSGVAMTECLPRLSWGDSVLVGQTWAKVIRCWEKGIAFEFETALDPVNFNEGIVL